MLLSELQKKDIIGINDGLKLGKIIDADIDENNGTLNYLIIERKYFKSIFSTEKNLTIEFNKINKVGSDVILVDIT